MAMKRYRLQHKSTMGPWHDASTPMTRELAKSVLAVAQKAFIGDSRLVCAQTGAPLSLEEVKEL